MLEQCKFATEVENKRVCESCIRRRKRGKGFSYIDSAGESIQCEKMKGRIDALGIPPAWQNVNICQVESYKVQAIGTDVKGRAQYIYHPKWTEIQQARKFALLPEFAKKLPRIRRKCHQLIQSKSNDRDTVLALATLILAETGMRIGNQKYSQLNKTFGLSTLQMQHVASEEDVIEFSFPGKHSKEQSFKIVNSELVETIESIIDNFEDDDDRVILSYDNDGVPELISHYEVNNFIKKLVGPEFSSKYFRTWTGSRLALYFAPKAAKLESEIPNASFEAQLVTLVANELGNTPTICRKYYIHPTMLQYLIETFESNKSFKKYNKKGLGSIRFSPCEKEALRIISSD